MNKQNDTIALLDSELHPLINPGWLKKKNDSPLPYLEHKDNFSRVNRFLSWLERTDRDWITVKLSDYRDYLVNEGLQVRSIASILPTIRAAYKSALSSNDIVKMIHKGCISHLEKTEQDVSPANVKAMADMIIEAIRNNIDPLNSSIADINIVDVADSAHTWLTPDQISQLLALPKKSDIRGFRDMLMLSYMVGLGLRESEVCGLKVSDINLSFGSEPAARIDGKGRKQRLVPYGGQKWIIQAVDEWLSISHIVNEKENAYIFRGLHSRWDTILPKKMSVRTVQRLVDKYQLSDLRIKPHDLRRTYARLLYKEGMDIERISQNMGHSDIRVTRDYVGTLSIEERSPGLLFEIPL